MLRKQSPTGSIFFSGPTLEIFFNYDIEIFFNYDMVSQNKEPTIFKHIASSWNFAIRKQKQNPITDDSL